MALSSRSSAGALALLVLAAAPLAAQTRRTLDRNDPEALLMGYYAAVMQFSPIGLADKDGRLEIGVAGSIIPSLSLSDRLVGFGGTKPEDANKCPIFPRLVLAKGFGNVSVELGYTPPVSACDVKASIASAAALTRFPLSPEWDGAVRLSGVVGSLRSAITCSVSFTQDPLDQTCYGGTPSDDRVAPLSFSLDFIAAREGRQRSRLEPYFLLGFRYERVDFDANYTRTPTQGGAVALPPLDDHERTRATLAGVQLAVGASWAAAERFHLAGELYYAPGALITLRGRASVLLGGTR
ncbi:MAG: hypothetical protein ACHQU1_05565 [Gemmatimonadales bacterium]